MSDLGEDRRIDLAVHREGYRQTRKKRYTSIDAEGNLRILHSKGEKCKGCKNSSTPVGEAPCLKCLAGDGFPNFTPKDAKSKEKPKEDEK